MFDRFKNDKIEMEALIVRLNEATESANAAAKNLKRETDKASKAIGKLNAAHRKPVRN